MDKLTELIKEARPLYKKRKLRKAIAKSVLSVTLPAVLFSAVLQICIQGNDIYLSLDNNKLQNELLQDDFEFLR